MVDAFAVDTKSVEPLRVERIRLETRRVLPVIVENIIAFGAILDTVTLETIIVLP